MATLNEALLKATAYWESSHTADNRMMPIRAAQGVSLLGGSMRLSSLTPSHGTRLLTLLAKSGRQRSTIQAYYAAFKRMLTLAGVDVSAWPAPPKAPRKKRLHPARLTDDRIRSLCLDLEARGFGETAEL